MKRRISRVAVIGSGIMGSGIACHFANIGVAVLLLDVVPRECTEGEKAKGLARTDPAVRNRMAVENLAQAAKSKPAPLYDKAFIKRIQTGNLEDDLPELSAVDWIVEAVVERLEIKRSVFEKIEKYRRPGTLITSNTSGIPIGLMAAGRSEDFQKHFAGSHFFNPPRYLKLLEVIPAPHTSQAVIDFLLMYGAKFLGKTTVLCKDTPAFIANRVGIFSIMKLFHEVKKFDLTIEEVDALTGPVIGRPKSATFRTVDVVGLDTLVRVAKGLQQLKGDEQNATFSPPDYIQDMLDKNWLGAKTGSGFYRKTKGEKSEIHSLDLDAMRYRARKKVRFAALESAKRIDGISDRFPFLIKGTDKAAAFYRSTLGSLFAYVSHRIPEIADELYRIDDAIRAGFGWRQGPFEIWDAVGIRVGIRIAKENHCEVAKWVGEMQRKGMANFYRVDEKGTRYYYDIKTGDYQTIPGQAHYITLSNIRPTTTVWKNRGCAIEDLGDGILNIEFRSKMNAIGGEVIQGLNKGIEIAERDFQGVVIANQGQNFSAGANLSMIFMLAVEREYEELNRAVQTFQHALMRIRYSAIPVVAAPHAMTLGGSCELCLHADRVVAAAETYMGLVECSVGLIPAGGGSKEMTQRAAETFHKGDVELNRLRDHFTTIGMARVSTSAYEAFASGFLKAGRDLVVVQDERRIAAAKQCALARAENGYTKPVPTPVKVLGKQALGVFLVGADSLSAGNYISEHDKKVAGKLAYVMAGGDLSEATYVSEQYLLDLEREAFLSLCTEKKTLARIQHILKTGKPLRN
ncbi:MAG: 3-hydroxyacyl-CoA dehydrogenase NAD-binding domain-containing protein [Flavobacteriales bacterium]